MKHSAHMIQGSMGYKEEDMASVSGASQQSHPSRQTWERVEIPPDHRVSPLINRIRDLLYSVKKTPKEIFLQNTDGAGLMRMHEFVHMIGNLPAD